MGNPGPVSLRSHRSPSFLYIQQLWCYHVRPLTARFVLVDNLSRLHMIFQIQVVFSVHDRQFWMVLGA